jgi:phosphomannomutase
MNKNIFKAYDIRGIYPTDINVKVVKTIGQACAHILGDGEIIVAHDIRHGSPEMMKTLEDSISEEAQKLGKTVSIRAVGLSTTPMFYFLVNNYKAAGGCMVTASHNPKNYNGVKMVGPGAQMIAGTKVLEVVESFGNPTSK